MILRNKLRIQILVGLLVVSLIPNSSANAVGTKPKLIINCGQISGGVDENGTYGLFKPTISVRFYGKPLKVTAYFYDAPTTPKSEAGQSIWELSGSGKRSQFFSEKLNLERKILEYGQKQTGYYRIVFEAIDSVKRKSTYTCLYKDYYFSTPIVTSPRVGSGSSGSGLSSRGFDSRNCTFNGKKLYGSVYFTSSSAFADFSVYVSSSSAFADLSVYFTSSSAFASSCGTWYRTSSSAFADFTVYLTSSSSFADFSIYSTSSSAFAGT